MKKDFYQHLTPEELATEVWKPVVNYEKEYLVSNLGRVKRISKGNILQPRIVGAGYLQVNLSKSGFVKEHKIHKLVLEAFDQPKPENKQADHISRNKQDNRLVNLHWVTHRENCRNQITNRKIIRYSLSGEKFQEFNTVAEAAEWLVENANAKNYDAARSGIEKNARGIKSTAYGFIWGYEKELNGRAKFYFLKEIKKLKK